jgi:hypothetical protein
MDAGISIERSPLHENASRSIRDNSEDESNGIAVSDRQKKKHFSQVTSTGARRSIDRSPLHENSARSIRDNWESDGMVIETSDSQQYKQRKEITSTDAGR